MLKNNPCFCGSSNLFYQCCAPFITHQNIKQTFPQTPEQLMRSRFSAYVVGNSQYIYDTYAQCSQVSQSVEEINDWGKACKWIALAIHSKNETNIAKNKAVEQFVEFSAFYITEGVLYELRECSRFILEAYSVIDADEDSDNLQWRYIDGDITKHDEISIIKRKDLCPCNHYPTAWSQKKGKKFKQCCGK